MTLLLVVALAAVAGAGWPRRRTLLFPLVIGMALLFALALARRDWLDTPIPFLIAVATAAMAFGQIGRTTFRTAR